jgi:fatty-acid desaturase
MLTDIQSRYVIVSLQLLCYISIIPMVMYAQWYHYMIAFFVYFLYNGIGMIMTYHRLLSHRVFNCPKWLEYVMASLATFSVTGSAITWVSIHRKHHRYADTEKDPHSPDWLGWWRVQFLTAFAPVEGKYAIELMRDKFYLFQHKHYIHILFGYALLLALIDPILVIVLFLFPAGLTLFFGTLILSCCHKDYNPRDIFWLGIVTFGDAFHELHHENSRIARLHKYDLIGFLIEKIFYDKPKIVGEVA